MQRGSKPPTSDPLFETEDILGSLGLDDDMEETMEIDRVVWNSSIQKDVETKLLADHPPSTSAVIPSTTRPKAITSSPKPASAQAAPGLLTTAGSSRNMEIRDDTFGSFRIGSTPPTASSNTESTSATTSATTAAIRRAKPPKRLNKGKRAKSGSKEPKICWYHKRFGSDSRKCIKPCSLNQKKTGLGVPVYEDNDIDDEVGGYAEYNFNIDEDIDQPRPLLANDMEESRMMMSGRILTLQDKKKMILRKRAAVVRVSYFNLLRDKANYCYSTLMQFVPFRNETELTEGYENEVEAFEAKKEVLVNNNEYMKKYFDMGNDLETALRQLNALSLIGQYDEDDDNDDDNDDAIFNPSNIENGMDAILEPVLETTNHVLDRKEFDRMSY
ncbi:hypothetical protein BLOT_000049 [Blomia tropicalis]|nr:hypothetical protein BLOT_000049 [Blomia tropicalis]